MSIDEIEDIVFNVTSKIVKLYDSYIEDPDNNSNIASYIAGFLDAIDAMIEYIKD